MKTRKPFFIVLLLLLGFGSGYWLRFQKSAAAEKQGNHSSGQVAPERSSRELSNEILPATQFQNNLKLADGQAYWLQWMAGIESASLNDFPKMAQVATANPVALRILALRWFELDPAHLFETLRANSSQRLDSPDRIDDKTSKELYLLLFQEWPKTDLAAATAALSGDAKVPEHRRMKWEFLNSLAETDPLKALETMKAWGNNSYGLDFGKVSEWVEQNPRFAVDAIIANNVGNASQNLLDAAARIWAKSDPLAAMELASSTEGKLGKAFRKGAFGQWLGIDLEGAANWLADHESLQVQDELRPAVIRQWARKDPEGAMAWTTENLRGNHQARAMQELIATVATKDRDLALEFFDQIAPGSARNKSARIVAEEVFSSFSDAQIEPGEISPAVTWIKSLDPGARDAALMQVGNRWASTDPESYQSYLLSEHGNTLPNIQFILAAQNLILKDPPAILDWSKNLPPRKQKVFAKSAMERWIYFEPDHATKWFKALPKTSEHRPLMVEAYLSGFQHLKPEFAAERLRLLPKEDWKALEQIGLEAGRLQKIKELAEK